MAAATGELKTTTRKKAGKAFDANAVRTKTEGETWEDIRQQGGGAFGSRRLHVSPLRQARTLIPRAGAPRFSRRTRGQSGSVRPSWLERERPEWVGLLSAGSPSSGEFFAQLSAKGASCSMRKHARNTRRASVCSNEQNTARGRPVLLSREQTDPRQAKDEGHQSRNRGAEDLR